MIYVLTCIVSCRLPIMQHKLLTPSVGVDSTALRTGHAHSHQLHAKVRPQEPQVGIQGTTALGSGIHSPSKIVGQRGRTFAAIPMQRIHVRLLLLTW